MTGFDNRGAKFPLTIVRGSDVSFALTVLDDAAAAVDLSSATIAGEIYTTDGTLAVTMTDVVSGASSNIVTLSLTDTQTDALTARAYEWTLWVTRAAHTSAWLAGRVNVTDGTSGGTPTSGNQTIEVDGDLTVTVTVAISSDVNDAAVAAFVDDADSATTTALAAQYEPLVFNKVAPSQGWLGAFTRPPTSDYPTISVAAGSATSITNGVLYREKRISDDTANTLDPTNDPYFRYKAYPVDAATRMSADPTNYVVTAVKPGGSSQAAYWPWCVEFETDATQVEFRQRSIAADQPFALRVNGRWYSEESIARTVSAGATFTTKLTFPSSAWRRIEVWFVGNEGWGGAWISSGATIRATDYEIARRVAIIGDSLTNGAGSSPSGAGIFETWALRCAQIMGADEVYLAGIGGTKWEPLGAGTADELISHFGGDRLTDILTLSPDVLVFCGSRNDTDDAAVTTAVEDALDLCVDVPEVYVIGTFTDRAVNDRVKTGTESKGRPFIDVSRSIYGTGNSSTPTGDGNADDYMGSDDVHPTFAGHQFMTKRISAGLLGIDYDVAGRWYRPLDDESFFIPAANLNTVEGTPSESSAGTLRQAVWLLDASTDEAVASVFTVPPGWLTWRTDVYWTNGAGGSGNVRWAAIYTTLSDGSTLAGNTATASSVVAAPASTAAEVTALATQTLFPAGTVVNMRLARSASNVADTLANDVALIGINVVRLS